MGGKGARARRFDKRNPNEKDKHKQYTRRSVIRALTKLQGNPSNLLQIMNDYGERQYTQVDINLAIDYHLGTGHLVRRDGLLIPVKTGHDIVKAICTKCDNYNGGRIFTLCNAGPYSYITGKREQTWCVLKNLTGDCGDFTPRVRGLIGWFNRMRKGM